MEKGIVTITKNLVLDSSCTNDDLIAIRKFAFEKLSEDTAYKQIKRLSQSDLLIPSNAVHLIQGNSIISTDISRWVHQKCNYNIPGIFDNMGKFISLEYVIPVSQLLPVSIIEFDLDKIDSFAISIDFTSKDLYFLGTIGVRGILLAKAEENTEGSIANGFKNTFILDVNEGIKISSYRALQ